MARLAHRSPNFLAFELDFTAGLFVAAGNVAGDDADEIIVVPVGLSEPLVRVFDHNGTSITSFYAYLPIYMMGVRVAAGGVDGDGYDDVITTPAPGGGPHVQVFRRATPEVIHSFLAYEASVTNGSSLRPETSTATVRPTS